MTAAIYTRKPFIAATILCCLLALATSASAGCAWVLWYESSSWATGEREAHEWALVGAFPTEAPCSAEQSEKVRQTGKRWSEDKKAGRKDTVEVKGNSLSKMWEWPNGISGGNSLRYVCLPDTVDPRGPKGK